jgi:6-phosphofructokinase 1
MEKSESAVAKLAQAAQATDNTENDESELPKVFDRTHLDDPRFEDYSKLLKPRPGADFSRVFPPKICSWAPCGTYPSPFKSNPERFNLGLSFVSDEETVLVDIIGHVTQPTASREFLRAGPREFISFHPKSVKAAIVTCGGLCPGINSVVREIYNTLHHLYGVEEIYGIPFGYRGFYSPDLEYIRLTDNNVSSIHHQGGSYLGSSRGGFDLKKIVDAIEDNNFNQVYIIGGDGTQRGALKIHDEVVRRKLKVSVVGIPKTIDNDIALIDKSFGFDTAVEEAQRAIRSAVVESKSAQNGKL